jgi:transposase
MVNRFLEPLRKGVASVESLSRFSAKPAVWLFIQDQASLNEAEQQEIAMLCQAHPLMETAYQLVQDVVSMVRKRQGELLDLWLERVASSHIPELQKFAWGIEQDKAAVVAGLTLPYNNGLAEGHVNRLKLIKRMMYGRAGFPLLRQRVLHAA